MAKGLRLFWRKGPTFTKVLFFELIIHARKYRKRFFWEIIKIMGYFLVFLFVSSFAFMQLYHIPALLSSDPVSRINWRKAVFWLLAPCFTKKSHAKIRVALSFSEDVKTGKAYFPFFYTHFPLCSKCVSWFSHPKRP